MLKKQLSITFFILCMGMILALEETPKTATEKPKTSSESVLSDEALEATLKDKRYLMRQLKCALGEAPCDAVGRRIKSLAPLVLQGSCTQCSPQEQRQIRKVLGYMQVNFPKEWNKILKSYSG